MFSFVQKIVHKYYKLRTKDKLKAAYQTDHFMAKVSNSLKYLKMNPFHRLLILVFAILIPLGIYFLALETPKTSWLNSLLQHTSGNLLAELYGGYIFLVVAFLIQRGNDKKLDELHQELERLKVDRKYQRMMDFLTTGDHYNVSLRDKKDRKGMPLTYNISPVRDENNKPKFDYDGLGKTYIVKVNKIAFDSTLDNEILNDYLNSPISPGEYYFVKFRKDGWGFYDDSHIPFYWSGKNGHARSVPTANGILKVHENYEEIGSFIYDTTTGDIATSGSLAKILRDQNGSLFICPRITAKPKKIFKTYPRDDYQKNSPYMKIENIYGYFENTNQLENFKTVIQDKLKELELDLEEIDWWKGEKIPGL